MFVFTVLAPGAAAQGSFLEFRTPDPVTAAGVGTAAADDLFAWLYTGPIATGPNEGQLLLSASALTVREWSLDSIQVTRPGSDRWLTSNSIPTARGVDEYGKATLHLLSSSAAGRISMLVPSSTSIRLEFNGSLTLGADENRPVEHSLVPVLDDPRAPFFTMPESAVTASHARFEPRIVGSFRLLLENLEVRVTEDGARNDYSATKSTDITRNGVNVTHARFYIVDVEGGALQGTTFPKNSLFAASELRLNWGGELKAERAVGTLSSDGAVIDLSNETVALTGEVSAQVRRSGTFGGQPNLAVSAHPVSADPKPLTGPGNSASPPAQVTPGSRSNVWVPASWTAGMLLTLGLVGFALRPERAFGLRRASAPAAPVASAGATEREQLEERFRREPHNIALASELGIVLAHDGAYASALPLLLHGVKAFPKSDQARYGAGLCLLHLGRTGEGITQLDYSFRLNPLNVARFLKEGPVERHGHEPKVRALLEKWARHYHETHSRGYA